jgi:hypothetical protein
VGGWFDNISRDVGNGGQEALFWKEWMGGGALKIIFKQKEKYIK